ncbi:MAG: 30S ribosomal protein S3 [Planctomycetota bacterium]|nr:MAG: 30S ribosomal protein S3 [Planctomycetota bacterium]
MGQKINPLGFRIGITEPHRATWFARGREYGKLVAQDHFIRDFLKRRFKSAAIEKIHIERKADRTTVTLHSGRPGVVIGKRGSEIDLVTAELEKISGTKVKVNIIEVRKPQVCGQLVAENVADQLERRGSFRRAIKRAVEDAMREGAKGCMVKISGRLGGNEIARSEAERQGSVPLNQLQANIDYGYATARTTYGIIGVRVWVHHGRYEEQEN